MKKIGNGKHVRTWKTRATHQRERVECDSAGERQKKEKKERGAGNEGENENEGDAWAE